MTVSPKPVYRQWLGIAKEATKGAAVASTDFLPLTTITPGTQYTYLADEGMRGSMVKNYGEVQGVVASTFDLAGDIRPTSGYALAGILGDIVTTGATAPFSHQISTLNSGTGQPTGYTLTHFDVVNARQYPGQQFTDVGLKFTPNGLLSYTAKTMGWGSAIQASPPTPSYDSVAPMGAWRGTATVGGSAVLNVVDGSVDIKRTGAGIYTLQNSQQPYAVFVGAVELTGKLTFVLEDESQFNHYLVNDQPSLALTWTQGAGATTETLTVTCSKAAYTTGAITPGKDYFEMVVDFTGIGNVTDAGASGGYSPGAVTFVCAKPSGTFA